MQCPPHLPPLPSPPLLHPFPLQLCAGSGAGVGVCPTAFWLPSGFFNGLFHSLWPERGWPGLGLLGPTPLDPSRHPHQNGTVEHTHTKAFKKFCLSSLFNTLEISPVMELHDKRWLVCTSAVLFWALTGSISMVPGGPAKPSAPGRPARPGGPCNTTETSPD